MATNRRQKPSKKRTSTAKEAVVKLGESEKDDANLIPRGKIFVDGKERAFLLKSELVEFFGAWPKIVDRMLHATRKGSAWLEIVSNRSGNSGTEVRVTAESVAIATERLRRGEEPPLMPSERKAPKESPSTKSPGIGKIPDKTVAGLMRAGDLLPSGVVSATFNQGLKIVTLQWANGDYQHIRKIAKRGRNTRVISVCFDPSPGKLPVLLPSREGDETPDMLDE